MTTTGSFLSFLSSLFALQTERILLLGDINKSQQVIIPSIYHHHEYLVFPIRPILACGAVGVPRLLRGGEKEGQGIGRGGRRTGRPGSARGDGQFEGCDSKSGHVSPIDEGFTGTCVIVIHWFARGNIGARIVVDDVVGPCDCLDVTGTTKRRANAEWRLRRCPERCVPFRFLVAERYSFGVGAAPPVLHPPLPNCATLTRPSFVALSHSFCYERSIYCRLGSRINGGSAKNDGKSGI